MSQALRKLAGVISKSNTIVIFINQLREKVGVMFGQSGDHHRRQSLEVLCFHPHGCAQDRRDQKRYGNRR